LITPDEFTVRFTAVMLTLYVSAVFPSVCVKTPPIIRLLNNLYVSATNLPCTVKSDEPFKYVERLPPLSVIIPSVKFSEIKVKFALSSISRLPKLSIKISLNVKLEFKIVFAVFVSYQLSWLLLSITKSPYVCVAGFL